LGTAEVEWTPDAAQHTAASSPYTSSTRKVQSSASTYKGRWVSIFMFTRGLRHSRARASYAPESRAGCTTWSSLDICQISRCRCCYRADIGGVARQAGTLSGAGAEKWSQVGSLLAQVSRLRNDSGGDGGPTGAQVQPMGARLKLVSAKTACKHRQSINLTQPSSPSIAHHTHLDSPPPGARFHHVLSLDRLPGRPACCPPARPRPDTAPRTRSASFRILPVPGRRGQGPQVCQQRLCRPYHDVGARGKGRHKVPAAARPDRGSCQLRIPGTPSH
jgi:hypothetical protein